MRTLSRFIALSRAERAVAIEASVVLTVVCTTFWILPFRLLARLLGGYAARFRRPCEAPAPRIAALVASVAGRFPAPVTCLAEALVAEAMLKRRGYAPVLRLGVRKPNGTLDAHAWVECDGRVVLGGVRELDEYAVLSGPGRP